MRQELLDYLSKTTPEERAILDSGGGIRQALYTSRQEFVADSVRLPEKVRLIEMRPHTRFARFPQHGTIMWRRCASVPEARPAL